MTSIKFGIWLFGCTAWLFGLTERTIAALADSNITALDLILLFTASLFATLWLMLFPGEGE